MMTSLYIMRVERQLQRPLTASEREIVSMFFMAGYSVNYTVEYLR